MRRRRRPRETKLPKPRLLKKQLSKELMGVLLALFERAYLSIDPKLLNCHDNPSILVNPFHMHLEWMPIELSFIH